MVAKRTAQSLSHFDSLSLKSKMIQQAITHEEFQDICRFIHLILQVDDLVFTPSE